jgi:hypothetical protein
MRLAGVSSIDEAQAFADGFPERWNKRFAVASRQAEDAHRPWPGSKADLAEALARREERTLSKALTFSAGATRYAVKTAGPGHGLACSHRCAQIEPGPPAGRGFGPFRFSIRSRHFTRYKAIR